MQEPTLSILKQLYAASEQYVCLFDCDFQLLWQNRPNPDFEDVTDWSVLFNTVPDGLPPSDGNYTVSHANAHYSCRLTSSWSENGILIAEFRKADLFSQLLESQPLRHQLENKLASVRHNTFGISNAVQALYNSLEELDLEPSVIQEQFSYLNIIMGNCCRLLKSASFASELAKYHEPMETAVQRIELYHILPEFISLAQDILGRAIYLRCCAEKGVFIQANPDRFIFCLLCLLLCTNAYNPEKNKITVTAEAVQQNAVIHMTASELGLDQTKLPSFSLFQQLYPQEPLKEEQRIIRQFCREYHGDFSISHSQTEQQCSLTLPISKPWDGQTICHSIRTLSDDGRITPYHILLSDISDYRFY